MGGMIVERKVEFEEIGHIDTTVLIQQLSDPLFYQTNSFDLQNLYIRFSLSSLLDEPKEASEDEGDCAFETEYERLLAAFKLSEQEAFVDTKFRKMVRDKAMADKEFQLIVALLEGQGLSDKIRELRFSMFDVHNKL